MNLRSKGSTLSLLCLLALGCGAKSADDKKRPDAPKTDDKKPPTQPATEKITSAPSTNATAPSSSPSMTASQRVEAWKKKQPGDWKIEEKTVGSFIYAVAVNKEDETSQILATNWGEVEPPITIDRTSTEDQDPQMGTIIDVGDMDGDGRTEVVITYSLGGGDGGMVLYLDKPQGPTTGDEIGGPSNAKPTSHNGKPAIAIEIIDTGGDENGDFHNSKKIIFWNGKAFEQIDAPGK